MNCEFVADASCFTELRLYADGQITQQFRRIKRSAALAKYQPEVLLMSIRNPHCL